MKIYIVRHGETDWNKKGIIQGSTDIVLNDTGIAQAYQTKQLLELINFDCIYCSPLMRARQTADIINEDIKAPLVIDNRLAERNFGLFEGRNVKDIDFKSIWDLNNDISNNKIESTISFFERVHEALIDIIKLDYNNVIIVAHGGVSLPVYSFFYNLEKESDYVSYMLKNCEVACYDTKSMKKCNI